MPLAKSGPSQLIEISFQHVQSRVSDPRLPVSSVERLSSPPRMAAHAQLLPVTSLPSGVVDTARPRTHSCAKRQVRRKLVELVILSVAAEGVLFGGLRGSSRDTTSWLFEMNW